MNLSLCCRTESASLDDLFLDWREREESLIFALRTSHPHQGGAMGAIRGCRLSSVILFAILIAGCDTNGNLDLDANRYHSTVFRSCR